MPDTVQQLVQDVLSRGGFDASSADALRWLTLRHRKMVARSRCYRRSVDIGLTVSGQRDYPLDADVLEIHEVSVAGVLYGPARHTDLSRTYVVLDGDGGVVAPEEDATGGRELALYPTPTSGGDPILVRGALLPPDLSLTDDSTLKVPPDFTEALVSGAIGLALRSLPGDYRPDLAAGFESEFADACEELRRQVSRRYRGAGPARIRVAW